MKIIAEIKPDFDLTNFQKKMKTQDTRQRIQLIRALHERLWHCSKADLQKLLHKLGLLQDNLKLIEVVVDTCEHCRKYAKPLHRPTVGAELAGWFNENVFMKFIIFSLLKCLVIRSAGLCSPLTFWRLRSPFLTFSCTHKVFASTCRSRPSPCLL